MALDWNDLELLLRMMQGRALNHAAKGSIPLPSAGNIFHRREVQIEMMCLNLVWTLRNYISSLHNYSLLSLMDWITIRV